MPHFQPPVLTNGMRSDSSRSCLDFIFQDTENVFSFLFKIISYRELSFLTKGSHVSRLALADLVDIIVN